MPGSGSSGSSGCTLPATGPPPLLTAAGVPPRVVMEILGHSQIAVTMNVYAHVVQDTQREAIGHMDRLLRGRATLPVRSH